MVGKVQLELRPFLNPWWEVGLSLTARGLSSGLVPAGKRSFQMWFDLVDHQLRSRSRVARCARSHCASAASATSTPHSCRPWTNSTSPWRSTRCRPSRSDALPAGQRAQRLRRVGDRTLVAGHALRRTGDPALPRRVQARAAPFSSTGVALTSTTPTSTGARRPSPRTPTRSAATERTRRTSRWASGRVRETRPSR